MKSNSSSRPQTSKYRNESHIHFDDDPKDKETGQSCVCTRTKKRPQSYRNISKLSSYMTDTPLSFGEMEQVRYLNVIQNLNSVYDVPKFQLSKKNEQSEEFESFFQKNGEKMYKPIDQFTEYSDLVQKNSRLLRRNQFSSPIQSGSLANFKRSSQGNKFSQKASRYYTGYRTTFTNLKMANTISATLGETVKEKKQMKKQKQIFALKKQKQSKILNKTCLGYAKDYKDLVQKERSQVEKVPLANAMNRVLTMEEIGKKMNNLTQMFI